MELLELLQKRASVRTYTDEPIPEEKLQKVLQAGLLSMSGRNIKPWELIVVKDKQTLIQLSKSRTMGAKMLENASTAIIVVADETKTDVWTEDASIVMSYMHLMADSLGLGSCWIQGRCRMADETTTTEAYIQKLLSIPTNYRLEAILSLGMIDKHPAPKDLSKLPVEKIHYEQF